MACIVWEKDVNQNQNLLYPVEEDGKVFFKRDDKQKIDSKNNTPEALVGYLIAEFAKECRLSNPENTVPVFYVRKAPIF